MIPVVFVWLMNGQKIKRHATLPALPAVGDIVIPPGDENMRMHVRATEWDCSLSNGGQSIIHIALD